MIKRPDWDNSDWKPPPRRRPAIPPLHQDVLDLIPIFARIVHRDGLKTAREVFANFVREPTDKQYEALDQLELLNRLAAMTPRPNVAKLARELLAADGIHKGDAKFANKHAALVAKIRDWKKRRPAIEAKFAPTSPPLRRGQPPSFRFLDLKKRRK
ncbi:hypothetical protein [Bradyrhizobium sp. SZCCHNRI3043]|uniref:hypothetical protein n=1 Tax=Bradyrhizobium sp. SZCCHNRI3043 TaxID=3057292 RepID=UPI0028EE94C9|nr:hypothetical protein [Bradyrhizobium sp. SZCCHNRI3043]